jgi:phage terminase large subunit-like protein
MTFDPVVLTGQKVSGGVLVDELHVVAKMAKAPSAIRQLRGGMLPFPGAFMAFITTQSEDQPTGVFKAELDKARAIRDGKRMGAMLPVLYEFPVAMQKDPAQWTNPANWHMVTPNLGRSIMLPRLVEEYENAKATSEAELRGWASQHLDVEIGLALSAAGWAGAEFWLQAAAKGGKPRASNVDATLSSLTAMLARCEVAVMGIDGGGLDDLLGLVVLGRERGTRKWLLWAHAWAHMVVLQRRKEIAQALQQYADEGNLTLVEQPGEDVQQVAALCMQVRETGLLPPKAAIGVDAAGIGDIIDALTAPAVGFMLDGPEGGQIVAVSQGWKLNAAIKTTERALAAGDLLHDGSAFMRWVVGNAVPEPRGNAVLITKQAAGTAKIDPLMAAFNAVSLMSLAPVAQVIGEDDAEVLSA